jgi:hypothetical protein
MLFFSPPMGSGVASRHAVAENSSIVAIRLEVQNVTVERLEVDSSNLTAGLWR